MTYEHEDDLPEPLSKLSDTVMVRNDPTVVMVWRGMGMGSGDSSAKTDLITALSRRQSKCEPGKAFCCVAACSAPLSVDPPPDE